MSAKQNHSGIASILSLVSFPQTQRLKPVSYLPSLSILPRNINLSPHSLHLTVTLYRCFVSVTVNTPFSLLLWL